MLQSAKVIGPCLVCIPNGLDEPTIVLKTERKRPLCFQQNGNRISNQIILTVLQTLELFCYQLEKI